MATRKIILPSPNTVSASATSLISCPVGPAYRYRAIHLKIGAASGGSAIGATSLPAGAAGALSVTGAYVGDIRVKINGRVQRLHSANQLNRLNAINGTAYAASTWGSVGATSGLRYGQVLTIWFAEPWRKSLGQQDALAFPSSRVYTMEVEVDFGALPTNATSFNLTAYAEVDSEPASEIHKDAAVVSKVFRQNITGGTAAGAAVDITTLDRRDIYTTIVADVGNTAATNAAANGFTVAATGDFSAKLKITANSVDIHDIPKAVAALAHNASGLNANQFDLEAVLDSSDDIRSGLSGNGLSDLRVRIDNVSDTAANANWILITERTGPID